MRKGGEKVMKSKLLKLRCKDNRENMKRRWQEMLLIGNNIKEMF